MVLSNGEPVNFGRVKSGEEEDNIRVWINHLLGVHVHEGVEEVVEMMEGVLDESVNLLEEVRGVKEIVGGMVAKVGLEEMVDEPEGINLLEELCFEMETEKKGLVLTEREEILKSENIDDVESTENFQESESGETWRKGRVVRFSEPPYEGQAGQGASGLREIVQGGETSYKKLQNEKEEENKIRTKSNNTSFAKWIFKKHAF